MYSNKRELRAMVERGQRLCRADDREDVVCYVGASILVDRDGYLCDVLPFSSKAEVHRLCRGRPVIYA